MSTYFFKFLQLLDAFLLGITTSAKGLKVCLITAGIKKYKSIIKKKKKHNNIISLAKSKLDSTEVLVSKVGIDSNIIQDEFILINNVPKVFDYIKEEIKNSNDK